MEITLTYFDEDLKKDVEFQAKDGLKNDDYALLAFDKKTGVKNDSLPIADHNSGASASLQTRFNALKMSKLRKKTGGGSVQLIP